MTINSREIMDTILLRTLAYKSFLGFGKYADFTVGYLLAERHTLYLRWVYYNCSMISFHDDILEQIFITDEYKIDKPGKDPEMFDKITKVIQKRQSYFSKYKSLQHNKRVKQAIKVHRDIGSPRKFTCDALQRRNRGHTSY